MSESDVELEINGADCDQHQFFQCCHIGMVFYSSDQIDDYRQMEFNLSLLEDSGDKIPINCKGVVVDSSYEEDRAMFKTYLLYTEIDEDVRDRLRRLSKEKDLRCPFCAKS